MDPLASILRVTQLGAPMLSQSELFPPWGLEVATNMRGAVHAVQRGSCWLRVGADEEAIRLVAGDVVLVPRGAWHTITSDLQTPAEPYALALSKMGARRSL